MACSISMTVQLLSTMPSYSSPSPFHPSTSVFPLHFNCTSPKLFTTGRKLASKIKSMVHETVQGPLAAYANEMERLSAKESLLLAFRDAGGFEALVSGRTTEMQRIDVNERIVGLERLNPTPRPTTSPFLEGQWNFEWFGSGTLGFIAAQTLFVRFPPEIANLSRMDVLIKDGYAKGVACVKLFNSIESNFTVSTKLSVEGPLRMKEEFLEGVIESPKVNEESIPQQLKGAFGQAASTLQQLPSPVKDVVAGGLKVPLGSRFERLIMISYLDKEILIVRDTAGVPEVLTRLDPGGSSVAAAEIVTEYES